MTTHVGFALPNCRDKKDDRSAEKIKWVAPEDKERHNGKWWNMDQWNKQVMQGKTQRMELCRNFPQADDWHAKLYHCNNVWLSTRDFAKSAYIGCKVHVFCPAEQAAEPAEVPAEPADTSARQAPATPPKAAAPVSAHAPKAAPAASAPAASAPAAPELQHAEEPTFEPPAPGSQIVGGFFQPRTGPGFKSPPSPTGRPSVPPEEEVPAAAAPVAQQAGILPASTSTSSAASQPQTDHCMAPRAKTPPPAKPAEEPAVPAARLAVPSKPRPAAPAVRRAASSSAPQAAEPADVLQSTLGRQRVRFSPEILLTHQAA